MTKKNIYIFAVQGFIVSGRFYAKELASVTQNLDNGMITKHFIFKPPFPYHKLLRKDQVCVGWLEKFFHKLRWKSGFVDYSKLENAITRDFDGKDVVYVKGKDKVAFLSKFLKCAIIDLDEFLCPSLNFLNEFGADQNACFRNHGNHCALINVMLLRQWCDEFLEA